MNILSRSLLAAFTMAVLHSMHANPAANEKVVFDFTTATSTVTNWQAVNDDVMGGVSSSNFALTNGTAVFCGTVSLENNGGFASVRSLPAPWDLTGCDAFVVRVRGDGRSYKFTARTDRSFDSAIYQARFKTRAGEWEEHRLRFAAFVPTFRGRVLTGEPPLDPAKIVSVGFLISDKQAGPFRLEVASVRAVEIR